MKDLTKSLTGTAPSAGSVSQSRKTDTVPSALGLAAMDAASATPAAALIWPSVMESVTTLT